MSSQNTLFETSPSHEATTESGHPFANANANPYTNPEMEEEYETASHFSQYTNPEDEVESGGSHFSQYTNPEDEWETSGSHFSQYTNPEDEWETGGSHFSQYTNPEDEWETGGSHFSQFSQFSGNELEDEGEMFFGGLLKRIGRVVGPIAKRLAPMAARVLGGMIPGAGAIVGPLAGQLVGSIVGQGEVEAQNTEAELFGTGEAVHEATTEVAHEAQLTEVLGAQAAEASTEAEAEATLGASLPLTITIMGGRRALRRVTPVLAQANARLVRVLRRQGGPAGRQLLRTVPAIQRRTVATLRAAARQGQRVTAPLAVRTMATVARRVLNNPATVRGAIARNVAIRQRVAPPHPRHAGVAARPGQRCSTCLTRIGV